MTTLSELMGDQEGKCHDWVVRGVVSNTQFQSMQ